MTAGGDRARAPSVASWCGALVFLGLFVGPVRADAVDDFWHWFEYEHEALLAPATRADREEALGYWLGLVRASDAASSAATRSRAAANDRSMRRVR